jgi:hypothetical protein
VLGDDRPSPDSNVITLDDRLGSVGDLVIAGGAEHKSNSRITRCVGALLNIGGPIA